jgi:zinc/manganese transport system ATP-binding protein
LERDHVGGGLAMNEPLIMLDNVTVAYHRRPAVHRVSGVFRDGSLTAIAGPNGAGKSTLVKAIIGEFRLSTGSIDRGALRQADFGYLPQAAEIIRKFPISVADTVMLGSWKKSGAFGRISREDMQQTEKALRTVGLAGFERWHIGSLSAGQVQRVLFARLLVQDARVILLDEPFTAIDQRTTRDLVDIVLRWHGEGRTVIAVLHDFDQVRSHFPETLLIARELVAWGRTEEVMTAGNLLRARAMAENWDDDASACLPEPETAG